MCWLCDHPEATWDDYLDQVLNIVANSSFCVQQVGGNRLRCGYSYTVGLSELDEPELLVTGTSATRAYRLVQDMGLHVLHDTAPLAGEVVPVRGGPVVQFVPVDVPEVHLPVAEELYGPALQALQMVWRDDHGKWPWDVGHRAGRGGQPVLGTPVIA